MNQKVILALFAMVIGMTMLLGVVGAMCEEEKTIDKEWEREKACLQGGGTWERGKPPFPRSSWRCYR